MSTAEAQRHEGGYALARTPEEYERLRAQARVWESATGRLLDQVGLAVGAACLDAGSGPGETMRMMAQRVGPAGRVVGIDVDGALGATALAALHAGGHRHCRFHRHDLTVGAPIPGAPFDLVYARLVLLHLPERAAVLARLWNAVRPGGHVVVQEYDMRTLGVLPALASVDEMVRVMNAAFTTAGCDVRAGARLPELFAQAGIGPPDGTDVAGRLESLARGAGMLERTFRNVLPAAIAHGVTTDADAADTLAATEEDARRFAERPLLWPLLIGAWKRKAQS
jgi:ubiquinone/menaquinone biosynthesis C-methylase UbiE